MTTRDYAHAKGGWQECSQVSARQRGQHPHHCRHRHRRPRPVEEIPLLVPPALLQLRELHAPHHPLVLPAADNLGFTCIKSGGAVV